MRQKVKVFGSFISWSLLLCIAVVSVISGISNKVNFNSNFSFKSNNVKAIVQAYQYLGEGVEIPDLQSLDFGENPCGFALFDDEIINEDITLGYNNEIEFSNENNCYILKVIIRSEFVEGERNIKLIKDFNIDFEDISYTECIFIGNEFYLGTGDIIIPPGVTFTIYALYFIEPHVSSNFENVDFNVSLELIRN